MEICAKMSSSRGSRRKRKGSKPELKWLVLITLVAGIVAAVLGWGGGAIQFIESYFGYRDNSYQPMDTERQTIQGILEQTQSAKQSGSNEQD